MTATRADFIEAGQGAPVILLHSSVAGARQWTRLMAALQDRYHLAAPNLFGYGATPAWQGPDPQTLNDQARLIAPHLSGDAPATLIGHSFGASVAMKAARLYAGRIDKLVLIEPNPFYLLHQAGRAAAYDEALRLRTSINDAGRTGAWDAAAQVFADYWTGPGSWAAMPPDRQVKFAEALRPNLHEWDAVMNETTPISAWAATLPGATTVITADDTVRTISEIVDLMRDACPHWRFLRLPKGGHMAALTRPEAMLPMIEAALA